MQLVKYLLLSVFICLIGCSHIPSYIYTHTPSNIGNARHIPVYIDKYFTEEDKLKIGIAIDDWNYALNNYIVFDIASTQFDMEPDVIRSALSNGLLILKIDSNSAYIQPSENGGIVLAFTNGVNGHVIRVIRDRFGISDHPISGDKNSLTLALRHEIGHALGLHHIMHEKTLMWPKLTLEYDQCIDKTTIEEIAKVQHLDVNKLNYCTYEE
jgi:hypothetical protein